MHKGKKHTLKNRGKRSRKYALKGGMGAGEYVSQMYGDLNAQMANANANNMIQPIHQGAAPVIKHGGKGSKRRMHRMKKGGNIFHPLNPASLQEPGDLSHGQQGGYFGHLLERAAVPFGLLALQRFAKTMKHRKGSKK